ncbi:MAG: beta-galactosidase [Planctomycetota bacterium]
MTTTPHTEHSLVGASKLGTEGEHVHVRTEDHGGPLINPCMGWCFHHYDNTLTKYGAELDADDALDDFPGLSTVYLRLAWANLEPEEGVYDWSIIDSVAQRYIDRGKRVALRITTCETNRVSATPEWVFERGAKSIPFEPAGNVEPDYDDPIYLTYLDRFLAVLADRYDGDPSIDFIDVGSFGVWGEAHTHLSSLRPYSTQTAKRHLDLHAKYFKRTLLVVPDEVAQQGRGNAALEHARRLGMSIRDDSIMVWGTQRVPAVWTTQQFWPAVPCVIECEHYGPSKENGHWGDGSAYVEAIERYHGSYASIHWYPREFLDANRHMIESVNRVLGYRIRPAEVSWTPTAPIGGSLRINARWINTGVAPCYPGGHPAYTLKTERGGVAGVFVDTSTDARAIPIRTEPVGPYGVQPGESATSFRVSPNLQPGTYRLFVSVGRANGTPSVSLPLDHDDGHRRYEIGSVQIFEHAH